MSGILIKICGITNARDAEGAVDAGADAVGFNFWARSPRFIEPQVAAELSRLLPPGIRRVGLFVDETIAHVNEVAALAGLDTVQWHGPLDGRPAVRFWLARSASPGLREELAAHPAGAEAYLIDTPSGERRGGTGRTFDWPLATGLPARVVLAGGLDASNVAAAVTQVRPWGIDACSRLETEPGHKDLAKMREFVRAVRSAEGGG